MPDANFLYLNRIVLPKKICIVSQKNGYKFSGPRGEGVNDPLKIDYTEVMIGLVTKISLAAGKDIAHYRDKLLQADGARARLGAGWPG